MSDLNGIHRVDADVIRDRVSSAVKDSDLASPGRQLEGVIAGLDVMVDILYENNLGRRLTTTALESALQQFQETYMMGYRWLIDGLEPYFDPVLSPDEYLTRWGTFDYLSQKARMETVYEDVRTNLRTVAYTLESVMAQKYRTYACDVAVLSVLGAVYGLEGALERLAEPLSDLMRLLDDTTPEYTREEVIELHREDARRQDRCVSVPSRNPLIARGIVLSQNVNGARARVTERVSEGACTTRDLALHCGLTPAEMLPVLAQMVSEGVILNRDGHWVLAPLE